MHDNDKLPHHNYVEDFDDNDGSSSVIFSLPEKVGALAEALNVFQVQYHYLARLRVNVIYCGHVMTVRPCFYWGFGG